MNKFITTEEFDAICESTWAKAILSAQNFGRLLPGLKFLVVS